MVTDFEFVRELVRQEAGIVLDAGKEYLVESRLAPLAKREGLQSSAHLVQSLRSSRAADLRRKVLDAMTTNETTFFRDVEPFELLRKSILPGLIEARRAARELKIWYAASSTGQEPYSVSMMLREHFPELAGWKIQQIGTDISSRALERARAGRYSQLEVNRGLPAALLMKYFEKQGLEWQLRDDIRAMVDFREINLNAPWPQLPRFDIVFLRNVMIYFDVEAKKRILGNVHALLQPDGFLFLGAAETTLNLDARFTRTSFDRAGCYRRLPGSALEN
jgi:chemotaxis protein methyltransferase CheR